MGRIVGVLQETFSTGKPGMPKPNMLTDQIRIINDASRKVRTNKMDKWNLTGCLRRMSVNGRRGGPDLCVSRITHPVYCWVHSLPFLSNVTYPEVCNYHQMLKMLTPGALGQARHLNATCPTMSSLAWLWANPAQWLKCTHLVTRPLLTPSLSSSPTGNHLPPRDLAHLINIPPDLGAQGLDGFFPIFACLNLSFMLLFFIWYHLSIF